jgi:hypothetical protein
MMSSRIIYHLQFRRLNEATRFGRILIDEATHDGRAAVMRKADNITSLRTTLDGVTDAASAQTAPKLQEVAAQIDKANFRDLHVRNFDRASAGDRAPGVCGRQPGAHQLNHLRDREAMRDHDCLGAAVAAGSEQFERAVPGRGQAAPCGCVWALVQKHYSFTHWKANPYEPRSIQFSAKRRDQGGQGRHQGGC